MTGAAFFALTATAVKKKTKSQTACLKINAKAQKKLSVILKKLLALNKTSQNLNLLRQKMTAAKTAALFTANGAAFKAAEKALRILTIKQKALQMKQKMFIAKSEKVKAAALKEFRRSMKGRAARNIYDGSFSPKKALAVTKKKIGKQAFIYKPEIFFSKKQALRLSWEQDLFAGTAFQRGRVLFGLSRSFVKDDCAATLKKTTWEVTLSL